jgi:NhaP-type Na+/H+ or K+/H+ antiporter
LYSPAPEIAQKPVLGEVASALVSSTPAPNNTNSPLITLATCLVIITTCVVILTTCVIILLAAWLVFTLVRRWNK